MKFDAYQMATDRICAMLEQGIKPWAKPWNHVMACGWSGQTGRPYSFLNQMLLADPDKKYKDVEEWLDDIHGEWLTFNQIKDRGGKVKKGEHGRSVVFFKMIQKKNEDGEDTNEEFPFLTASRVFHIRQCEGIEQKYHKDDQKLYDFNANLTADDLASDYIARSGVNLENSKSDRAYYRPSTDTVHLPLPEQFEKSEEYYATMFHEFTHSTGHPSRLNRINGNANFGDESYSLEELVAEIGSASIISTLGMESDHSFTNSVSYIGNWLKALRNDKTMIVKAASKAEKAVKMIMGIEEEETK